MSSASKFQQKEHNADRRKLEQKQQKSMNWNPTDGKNSGHIIGKNKQDQ